MSNAEGRRNLGEKEARAGGLSAAAAGGLSSEAPSLSCLQLHMGAVLGAPGTEQVQSDIMLRLEADGARAGVGAHRVAAAGSGFGARQLEAAGAVRGQLASPGAQQEAAGFDGEELLEAAGGFSKAGLHFGWLAFSYCPT